MTKVLSKVVKVYCSITRVNLNSYSFIFSHLFSKKKLEYFLIFVFLLFSKKKCISYTYVRVGSDKFNLDTNILSKNTSN
jgi:hypothetical protein